jgi:hypothetical protein
VQPAHYDPEIAALLTVVEAQLAVSRQILDYLATRGTAATTLAGSHAQLDQLQATLGDAQRRLLPAEPSQPNPDQAAPTDTT